MLKVNRPTKVVGGLLAALILGWFGYGLVFPRTLANDAHDALYALRRGDGSAFYRFLDPNEIRAVGWTPEKLDAVMKRIIAPAWAQCHGFAQTDEYINESHITHTAAQGVARATLTLPDGGSVVMVATVMASDDGGKASATDELMAAWWVEYLIRHPREQRTLASAYRSDLEGCLRDGPLLGEIGVPGVYNSDDKGIIPWDELAASRSRELAEYESKDK